MKTARFSFFVALLLIGPLGQTGHSQSPQSEHEEEYDDPPAPLPLRATRVSPGMISQFGPFTSHQVNVDAQGSNILGDAANEPSITVDPTNHNKMSIGWRQFNSVASNFRQSGYGYTNDSGATWTFPGVLENNVFRSDPVLGSDDVGRFFYLSLLQTFFDTMWGSVDGGQSWSVLGPATGGDKQWFTIDRTSSVGHGFQYQTWDTSSPFTGLQFSRSIDGGVTWMNPIAVPNQIIFGTIDVDSNGNVFFNGEDSARNVWCVRSTDAKNASVTPTFDQVVQVNMGGRIVGSNLINPVGLNGQLFLWVDRSGTSTNNNVYMLASMQPTGFSSGVDVMFVRSTDGGQTFSAPVRVNDDPINHNKWHWLGTFGVAPNGRLDAVWLDTRNAANDTDSQLVYSYSTDAGITWSPNVAVSNMFNPFLGYPNQNKMGDYITIVSDNTGGDVAYTATFNQEQDVYYVRVAPGVAPSPTPSVTPSPTGTPSPSPTASPTPTPSATPSPSPTPTPSPTPSVTPTPSASPAAQALNLSTRMLVQTDANVGIGGFIVTGSAPKRVILRAVHCMVCVPEVSPLADPVLELHGAGGFATITNDNWRDTQEAEIIATGLAPDNDSDSAIVATLVPGNYTAIVRGKDNTSGVALVEIYDLDHAVASKLANISTRAFVSTGADIVIAGFILGNNSGDDNIIVRGIGPSLTEAGVPTVLANPTMELRDSNGVLLRANNDWQDDSGQSAIISAAGLALPDPVESGIAATLSPGSYTALLSGLDNGIGVGLVEIYDRGQ